MEAKTISTAEFDRRFDAGDDVSKYLDWSKARRPGLDKKRVNVDFTENTVRRLDREAQARGVTRQALIKMWIADRLDRVA